jgi:YidC/Oxa1 family membrane protein insertase
MHAMLPSRALLLPRLLRARAVNTPLLASKAAAAAAMGARPLSSNAPAPELVLGNSPTDLAAKAIVLLHDSTGLPWWGTIIATALVMRAAFFPLSILTQRNAANLAHAKDDLERFKVLNEQSPATSQAMQVERSRQLQQIYAKHDVRMGRMFLPFAQAPFFISVFFALQKLAAGDPSFATGGAGWVTDLAMPDTTYALPVLSAVLMSATIELGGGDAPPTDMSKRIKMMMRLMPPLSIPLTLSFPGAVVGYWVTTNFFSLTQALFFKLPGVKSLFGIRALPYVAPAKPPAAEPIDLARRALLHTDLKPPPPGPAQPPTASGADHGSVGRESRAKKRSRV